MRCITILRSAKCMKSSTVNNVQTFEKTNPHTTHIHTHTLTYTYIWLDYYKNILELTHMKCMEWHTDERIKNVHSRPPTRSARLHHPYGYYDDNNADNNDIVVLEEGIKPATEKKTRHHNIFVNYSYIQIIRINRYVYHTHRFCCLLSLGAISLSLPLSPFIYLCRCMIRLFCFNHHIHEHSLPGERVLCISG